MPDFQWAPIHKIILDLSRSLQRHGQWELSFVLYTRAPALQIQEQTPVVWRSLLLEQNNPITQARHYVYQLLHQDGDPFEGENNLPLTKWSFFMSFLIFIFDAKNIFKYLSFNILAYFTIIYFFDNPVSKRHFAIVILEKCWNFIRTLDMIFQKFLFVHFVNFRKILILTRF